LTIGLEAVRAEQSDDPPRRAPSRQTTQRGTLRLAVAAALRTLADRLERPTTQAAPG
jgi:hypothetical protein